MDNDSDELIGLVRRLDRLEQQIERLHTRIAALESQNAVESPAASVPTTGVPAPQPDFIHAAEPAPHPRLTSAEKIDLLLKSKLATGERPADPSRIEVETGPRPLRPQYPFPIGPLPESAWRATLRKLNLLPPTPGISMEVQVGTWWLTRIGALILVIGAVFFGVYVSRYSTPAVRLGEFLIATVAVGALGLWLERHDKQLGSVVFAASLATLFFAAFGAFAITPIKVIETPAFGVFWQLAAAGAILVAALWRGSPMIANMATLCGYVACFFSFVHGFNDFALVAALFLAAAAVVFGPMRGWHTPARIGIPLAYVIYGCVSIRAWSPANNPGFLRIILFPLASMTMFIAADWHAQRRHGHLFSGTRKSLMVFNTSAAIILAFLAVKQLQPQHDALFYFIFSVPLLAAAVAYWRTLPLDPFIHLFFLKGTALFTLGLVSAFEGRTRWIALAIQSVVLVFSAKFSRRRLPEFLATAVWLASFSYFIGDWRRLEAGPTVSWLSVPAAMGVAYLGLSLWLFSAKHRWLFPAKASDSPAPTFRDSRHFVIGMLVGLATLFMIAACTTPPMRPAVFVIAAVAVAATALPLRHWFPLAAAILPLLCAHVLFRKDYFIYNPGFIFAFFNDYISVENQPAFYLKVLALNAFAVAGLTLAAAVSVDEYLARRRPGLFPGRSPAIAALYLFGIFTTLTALFDATPFGLYLLLAVALSWFLAFASLHLNHRHLPLLALFPMVLALIDLSFVPPGRWEWPMILDRLRLQVSSRWFVPLAALAAFALPVSLAAFPSLRARFAARFPRRLDEWGFMILATTIGFFAVIALLAQKGMQGRNLLLVFAAMSVVVAFLGRRPGLRSALPCALFYLLLAHFWFYYFVPAYSSKGAAYWPGFLFGSMFVAAVTLGFALFHRWLAPHWVDSPDTPVVPFEWALGLAALLLLFVLFELKQGVIEQYTTLCWGSAAVAVFLAGLIGRVKSLRLVAILGLAACVARIFLIDAGSALQRIYAFLGVGVVLIAVAFLYNKFRDRIQQLQ